MKSFYLIILLLTSIIYSYSQEGDTIIFPYEKTFPYHEELQEIQPPPESYFIDELEIDFFSKDLGYINFDLFTKFNTEIPYFKSSLKSFSTSLRLELDANGCIKSHDNFEYQRRASNYKEELMLFDLLVAFTLENYECKKHCYIDTKGVQHCSSSVAILFDIEDDEFIKLSGIRLMFD